MKKQKRMKKVDDVKPWLNAGIWITGIVMVCFTLILVSWMWASAQTEIEVDCGYADLKELPDGLVFLPHFDSDMGKKTGFRVVPDSMQCHVRAKGFLGWIR